MNHLAAWVTSCLLLSLRIMPTFLFAPPFTLARVPRSVTALLGLGLAMVLVGTFPEPALLPEVSAKVLLPGAVRELILGLVPVVVLQLLFGGLYLAGRTIDIQAGFGLAMLIDPTTRGQLPMVGTIFAYVAAVTFFAMGGQFDLLRFFAASLKSISLGSPYHLGSIGALAAYASTVSLIAFGIGGAAITALLLTDMVIAMLSRTVPQLNALLLGIQVKAILLLAVVPVALGFSGALFARLVADALETMPRLL